MLHAIIMAGGSGTRFWPASRAAQPKQLLSLVGEQSMIQSTVARLGELVSADRILVVTNNRLVAEISAQLPQLAPGAVLGEPEKRDTAPCIGLAAVWVLHHDTDAMMVVMPADHVIRSDRQFQEAIRFAVRLVEERPGRLVTFGIRPSYAAESFGYIEQGEVLHSAVSSPADPPAYRAHKFHEKPPADVAQRYVNEGRFLWNSGIFVWKADTILTALRQYEPPMYASLQEIAAAMGTDRFVDVLNQQFVAIKGRSIDYAVMERSDEVVVIEAPFQWDDVGSWQAIARLRGEDEAGNTIAAKHVGIDTSGSIVRGPEDHLIVTLGLEDCIVVHTPDATLVAKKKDEEAIRQIVQILEQRGWREYL